MQIRKSLLVITAAVAIGIGIAIPRHTTAVRPEPVAAAPEQPVPEVASVPEPTVEPVVALEGTVSQPKQEVTVIDPAKLERDAKLAAAGFDSNGGYHVNVSYVDTRPGANAQQQ